MKLVVLVLLFSSVSQACRYDTDCYSGSKCIKSGWSMYGACVGGYTQSQDSQRNQNPYSRTGQACYSNMQCDVGHACVKSAYSMNGVCS